jgi:hypothetical protein
LRRANAFAYGDYLTDTQAGQAGKLYRVFSHLPFSVQGNYNRLQRSPFKFLTDANIRVKPKVTILSVKHKMKPIINIHVGGCGIRMGAEVSV